MSRHVSASSRHRKYLESSAVLILDDMGVRIKLVERANDGSPDQHIRGHIHTCSKAEFERGQIRSIPFTPWCNQTAVPPENTDGIGEVTCCTPLREHSTCTVL